MDAKSFFDFPAYMARLTRTNRLAAAHGFVPCTCSGIGALEGALERYQTAANLVCTSDVCQESTFLHSGGWFKRRVFTVFLLARCPYADTGAQAAAMTLVRELLRQFQSAFIRDAEALTGEMLYLRADDIRSNELGAELLNGATGLYFVLSMDEPTELCYNPEEWAEEEGEG